MARRRRSCLGPAASAPPRVDRSQRVRTPSPGAAANQRGAVPWNGLRGGIARGRRRRCLGRRPAPGGAPGDGGGAAPREGIDARRDQALPPGPRPPLRRRGPARRPRARGALRARYRQRPRTRGAGPHRHGAPAQPAAPSPFPRSPDSRRRRDSSPPGTRTRSAAISIDVFPLRERKLDLRDRGRMREGARGRPRSPRSRGTRIRASESTTAEPSEVLARLHDSIREFNSDHRFCTAVLARVERTKGRSSLNLTLGGHPLRSRSGPMVRSRRSGARARCSAGSTNPPSPTRRPQSPPAIRSCSSRTGCSRPETAAATPTPPGFRTRWRARMSAAPSGSPSASSMRL